MRRWLSILAWKSNSLVRNLGPYYEGSLLERLQITIFPSYASTDDRFTSETGIIVGGTARGKARGYFYTSMEESVQNLPFHGDSKPEAILIREYIP